MISSILMLVTVTVYMLNKGVKIKAFPLFCGILAVMTSVSFIFTSNGSVRFFSFNILILLSMAWFISLTNNYNEKGDLGLIISIFRPLFTLVIPNIPTAVASIFIGRGQKKKTALKALLGVAIALPVLFVVVPLLISSDAAFSGLAKKLESNLGPTIVKVIIGLNIALFMISYCFALTKKETREAKESGFGGFDNTILVSFLSVLSICYLTYLFSQLAYFFSAFKGFLPKDYSFTIAQYARRGFFEMAIIAAINLAIIFTILLLSKKEKGKICVASRMLCTFIGIFTLIIIATAISKMVLYINHFGMTILRITTSSFMVFLAIVFISLMIRIFVAKICVLRTALVTASIILITLSIVNVNQVIAAYNYYSYKGKTLEKIDIQTIYDLGDEGVPYLIKLAEDEDSSVANSAQDYLLKIIKSEEYYNYEVKEREYYRYYKIIDKNYDGIINYSITRSRVYKELDEFIAENPKILSEKKETSDYVYW